MPLLQGDIRFARSVNPLTARSYFHILRNLHNTRRLKQSHSFDLNNAHATKSVCRCRLVKADGGDVNSVFARGIQQCHTIFYGYFFSIHH